MNKNLLRACLLFSIVILSSRSFSQSFTATYDFGSVTTTSGRTDPTSVPIATGVTFGSFTAVGSMSANPNATGRFSFTGWPTGATDGSNTFTGSINTTQYYEVTLTPQLNYTLTLNSITFTLQRSGTGIRQYAVRSSIDGFATNLPASINPANAALQVVSGDIFQVTDVTTAQDGSTIAISNVTNITTPVTYRFYGFNAEASGGTFSIDNVKFFGTTTLSPTAPNIIVDTNFISFPATAVAASSIKTYHITGANLTAPVNITTTSPYTISDASGGTYSTSLTLQPADISSAKTLYVKFSPPATGSYTGTITHTSSGAGTKTISLAGDGVDPTNLVFNFDNCSTSGAPGSGFTVFSDSGAQRWSCSNFGRNGTKGVDINGYSGGPVGNSDWLISPALQISSLNLPILSFWSRGEFSGPSLQLLVSTNYDGSSDPNTATWTDLQANFPPLTNTWTLTDGIDLSTYKSFPSVYIAFKYTSSAELGAARWTVDDVTVTNRTTLLANFPALLNFEEVSSGNNSAGIRFTTKAIGYGNVTLTAPANYFLSTDSINYFSSITIPQSTIQNGVSIFARFSPTVKALKIEGQIRFQAAGLDSNSVTLTGTSYPKSETFDAGCYNLSFFGSNSNNNPTQDKINTQVANIATVLNKINLDIVGVEEISNDVAFDSLLHRLQHRKAVVADRYSYSFDPPDPNFPPQKTGFIYDSTTVTLISARDMFVNLYDSVRNGHPELLPNYPGGTPQSFWASGRLPFMATFNVTIQGITKRVIMIDIHAKSASDVSSYNRRVYDAKVLKDSLVARYSADTIMIVGDYNDRVVSSIYTGSTISPYLPFVNGTEDSVLTYPLDAAGRVSFISGTGLIDQITISNELVPFYIGGSTDIEDPRTYISGYNATTASDHLPVYTRFNFAPAALPVTLTNFTAQARGSEVVVKWTTATELNSSYFVVERSADANNFTAIARVNANGTRNTVTDYQTIDASPLKGINYYRLKQVDLDGKATYSNIVAVNFTSIAKKELFVYPNPVNNYFKINLNGDGTVYTAQITGADGRLLIKENGTVSQLNTKINSELNKLNSGVYMLQVGNSSEKYVTKFIKE